MHPPAMLRAFCAAAVFVSPCVVVAAAPAPTPTPSAPPQIVHVVTSDRSDEALSSSARTTYVVTKAEMLRRGFRTVADALATLPGVNLVRYGPGGAAATLGIRGSSSAQVLILMNGTPIGGAQILDADVAAIPTAGVERIEVVEGGGSTLYGSGSIGGVVNIITTPLHRSVADVRVGSFGERDLRIQTPNVSFERSVATDAFGLPDGTTRANADYGLTSGRISFDKHVGALNAAFSAGVADRHQGVPGYFSFMSPTSRQNDVNRDARLTLSLARAKTTTTLELAGTSTSLAYTCNTPVDANCPNSYLTPPLPYAQLVTEGRVQAGLRTTIDGARTRTVAGIDLARGVARIDSGTDPLQIHAFAQTAAYVQQNWSLAGGSELYAGIRAERDGGQGGAFSPSIGGIARVSSALALHLNAATAFRAPTAEDLYYPGFSNPHLVPERTRVADATLTDAGLLGGVSLGWFSTSGKNFIVPDPTTFVPYNVGRASLQGFTFTAQTPARTGVYANLNLTDLYRAENLDTGTRISGRGPVLQTNLQLGYRSNGGWLDDVAFLAHSAGERTTNDPTVPLFAQSIPYTRIDGYIRVRTGARVLLTLRGFDLGNERYGEFAGYPMPGRSFAIELSTR